MNFNHSSKIIKSDVAELDPKQISKPNHVVLPSPVTSCQNIITFTIKSLFEYMSFHY